MRCGVWKLGRLTPHTFASRHVRPRLLMKVLTQAERGGSNRTPLQMAGAGILLVIAAIHVLVYVGYSLTPGYPGFLFLLNAAVSAVLAVAVLANIRPAWPASAVLAALTIVFFVLVHTVGLPAFQLSDWLSTVGFLPLGPLSLTAEVLLIALYLFDRLR